MKLEFQTSKKSVPDIKNWIWMASPTKNDPRNLTCISLRVSQENCAQIWASIQYELKHFSSNDL